MPDSNPRLYVKIRMDPDLLLLHALAFFLLAQTPGVPGTRARAMGIASQYADLRKTFKSGPQDLDAWTAEYRIACEEAAAWVEDLRRAGQIGEGQ